MMKLKLKIYLAFTVACLSVSTYANESSYIGLNFSSMDYNEASFEEFKVSTTNLVLGKSINSRLSAEFRYGLGTFDNENEINGVDTSVEIDKMYGYYVKYAVEVNGYHPYAIVGYTNATLVGSGSNSVKMSNSDNSFGVGLRFGETESSSFNVEYMNYLDTGNASVDGFSVGLKLSF